MAARPKRSDTPGYPIGITSRLTNIHPETLRIWERRYAIVEPTRASRGRRFYSDEDVRHLALVKTLVDQGHPISAVAGLSLENLEARLKATADFTKVKPPLQASGPCKVIVIGESLPMLLRDASPPGEIDIVASVPDAKAFAPSADDVSADVLLWETATAHSSTVRDVSTLLRTSRARRAVVVYGFASRRAIADLEAAGVRCVHARSGVAMVRRVCLEARKDSASRVSVSPVEVQAIPPRRFAPEQLARIALASPTIACECPHHLVELITSLDAFEKYSEECEDRSPQDARLHALLHSIAASARALLETGLERVIEADGIKLDAH